LRASEKAASPKAKSASVEPLPAGWEGYMHDEYGIFYGKPGEDMGMWVRPKDRPVVVTPQSELAELRKKQPGPKAKVSAKLRAHGAAAMGGPKSRKRSDPLLDLEKQIEAGVNRERRLERYQRLVREGRKKEAIRYMRKHNMLHEVMDMSDVVRLEDLEQLGSPPKKGSPSGSRKRSSGKSSDSRSRKIGKSFGKMAELLEKEEAFKPAHFKEKPKAVAGIRGAVAGKKGDPAIDSLHKKVVNPATSPTFQKHDPKMGDWMG
jgi:hypothetical protein